MPDGLVTNRPLQNEATGVDLQVPLYQEVRGAMMTGHVEYQIIVVTRLAAFKSPRHKPGDTVQLVVSKSYSEIDEVHSRLVAQYPHIPMPAMPRKALFVGESDIRERRASFDELLRFIASHPTLAACSVVLEFLGAKSTEEDIRSRNVLLGEEPEEEEVNFFQGDGEAAARKDAAPQPRRKVCETEHKEEDDEEEEEDDDDDDDDDEAYLGPLGNTKKKKSKKPVQKPPVQPKPKPQPAKKVSLFTDDDTADTDLFTFTTKDGDVKLFEDPDLGGTVNLGDSSLLLPTAYEKPGTSASSGLDDDTDELFRVEDDFAKLLQLTKRPKDKPALPPKPAQKASSAAPGGGGGGGRSLGKPAVAVDQLKDQMDIFKYIEQNQTAADDDDLF